MQELLWVAALLLLVGAWAAVGLVPGDALVLAGRSVMLGSAALGIPLELVYFALLGWALHTNGATPEGWYWRSFAHHHLLSPRQRLIVLPPFYAGALAFLGIGLGIAITVLGFVSVLGLGRG